MPQTAKSEEVIELPCVTTAGVQASERPTPRCSRVQRTELAMVCYLTVLCMPVCMYSRTF